MTYATKIYLIGIAHTYRSIKSTIQVISIDDNKHSNLQENNHIYKHQEVKFSFILVNTSTLTLKQWIKHNNHQQNQTLSIKTAQKR